MGRLPQSTSYVVMLKVYLTSDHVTPATGKTVAVVISKAGGAFANPNAGATNATEVSNGWYKVTLDTTDTNTIGELVIRGTSATCDDSEKDYQVVSATTGGATNLDAAITTLAAFVDTEVAAILAAVDTEVAAIKAKTDSLTFTTANRVDSQVFGMQANTITDAAIAADAIGEAALAAGTANEIADALLDRANGVETGLTLREALRLVAAATAGKLSGAGTGTEVIRNAVADSKNRISATVDASGNRSAITTDLT